MLYRAYIQFSKTQSKSLIYLLTHRKLSTSSNSDSHYDFIIVGGGLVGSSLAAALGSTQRLQNKKILLLESSSKFITKEPIDHNSPNPQYSNRVVSLSPASKKFLEKFGIWEHIWRSNPVFSLQIWDALSDSSINFNNLNFSSPVSYIVENPVLGYAISKVLEKCKNVQVEFSSSVKSCTLPKNLSEPAIINLDNKSLSTYLLIGADGFKSQVKIALDSQDVSFNYERTGVVATLKLNESSDNNVSFQRFLPTGGPIALLPLSPLYTSLVWSTTIANAKELLQMPSDSFVDAVNSALWENHPRSSILNSAQDFINKSKLFTMRGPRLLPPSFSEVVENSRASFPLGFSHSVYYSNWRSVLIGDAAHRVHPLAGLGLNLGLGDIECLCSVIEESVKRGADYGDLKILQKYETERQRYNVVLQAGIDMLHRLYDCNNSGVVALRSIGLSAVNSSDAVKKLIISLANA